MAAKDVTESDVISWTEKALKKMHLTDFQVNITGKSEKGDGYSGEIVFVSASGITKDNKKVALDLVVKYAKSSEILRRKVPVRDIFQTEIQLYNKVFPTLARFQLEKNISDVFDAVPRCHFTLILDQMEVLILENLRQYGYELRDRKETLNFNHLQLVLKEYGKFHALSFALKDQNIEEFRRISELGSSAFSKFFEDESVKEKVDSASRDSITLLRERGHENLCKKYENVLVNKAGDMLLDIIDEMESEQQRVIIHGDCWNNNFMFKYEGDDRTSPSEVKILDWQMSTLRSPVSDLSYFIYANSSQKELDRFGELMEIYYSSFSDFLKQLGSDPEQLFTFDDLKRHWKKYSIFGFLFLPMAIKITLCNKEEAPALEDVKEDQEVGNLMDVEVTNKEAYYERIKAIASNYLEYEF